MVKGTHVCGYVRVSTVEQAESGAGIEAQKAAIRAECKRRGWILTTIHEDAGLSGKSLKRPGLEAALASVNTGKCAGMVVAKLDRLSRSLQDFASVMTASYKRGWSLVILDVNVDTTTPSGELMANVMASFAQFERRIIGQRTKDALSVKRAQGVRLGRPRSLPLDVVARVRGLHASGLSLRVIAEQLNADGTPTGQGGASWYASTVRAVVRSTA